MRSNDLLARTVRYRIFVGLVVGSFAVLGLRLADLQILHRDLYAEVARDNAIRAVRSPAPRGRIYDRDGRLLVNNETASAVTVTPYRLGDDVGRLADLLGLPDSTVEAPVDEARRWSLYRPTVVAAHLRPAIAARVFEEAYRLPGVEVVDAYHRTYPPGPRAAHALGTLAEVGPDELARREVEGLAPGDLVGQTGLERTYDALLRGRPGRRFELVDVRGRAVGRWRGGADDAAPVSGYDLTLTLDADVQALAESLFVGKRGAAVALDSETGEILAYVSGPDYAPAMLVPPVAQATWARLSADPARPLYDRAALSAQPLGSTIKPLMGLAGLEEGVITPSSTYPCNGSFVFGGRRFGGHGSYGPLGVEDAIRVSCNEFFYALGLDMGLDTYARWGHLVGFGEPMPTDLPSQSPGLWPDSSYFDRTYGAGRWTRGYLVSLGIGQGNVSVTTLQLARYTAALANGGRLVTPHLARVLRQPASGDEVRPGLPTPRRLPVSPANLAVVQRGMRAVVTSGTARVAAVPGVAVAGKTGTAQNPQGEDHSLFIAYAPAEAPRIAVAVFVENGGFGSTAAAPIASLLIEQALTGRTTRPDLVRRLVETVRSEPLEPGP